MFSFFKKKKKGMTRIKVRFDVGMGNALYLRGSCSGLNWEKGVELKNSGPDLWVWETNHDFKECEFKVLLNDQTYESGENHYLYPGADIEYTPHFD